MIDLGSIGRSVFSSLVGGLVNLGLGAAFPALAPALGLAGARASGGPVVGGSAYLVGEQGPELFVPQTAGTVVSSKDTAAAVGGAYNITVNVVDSLADPLAVRRIANKLQPELVRVASYQGARK